MKLFIRILPIAILFSITSCSDKEKNTKESESNAETTAETQPVIPNISIAMATPDLKASLDFWTKLGFTVIEQGDAPYPFAYITDGSALIGLFEDGDNYLGFCMWVEDVDSKVKQFLDAGFLLDNDFDDMKVVITPDSLTGIAILGTKNTFPAIPIKSMLHLNDNDYGNENAFPNKMLGIFGEFSIPVDTLNQHISLWEVDDIGLYFKDHYSARHYAILTDGEMIIGLHEDAEFTECAITYFAPDARKLIEKIKAKGITDIKDLTDKMPKDGDKHFIITTPEGKQLFLFSML
jgi:catechol 2,3-dioxygenase-like lactoylglutathione lyase family enzyme